MGALDWLRARMVAAAGAEAMVWRDAGYRHADLLALWDEAGRALDAYGVGGGRVVSLEADYAPHAVAMLLAMVDRAAVVVPLSGAVRGERAAFLQVAEVGERVLAGQEEWKVLPGPAPGGPCQQLTRALVARGHPGVVLFTSGVAKAALHDLTVLLERFQAARAGRRTLAFLPLDHVGGLGTLFGVLAAAGALVSVADRDPEAVCAAVARHRVELLPTSPTFLNLLLTSGAYRRHDLSSLQRVTYGTGALPQGTLERLGEALPGVALVQADGLTEVGILPARSRGPSSPWVRVGGDGFQTKVVDGTLRIRARSAMLGYLDHPSPFDADGWLDSGDEVETDGEWLRFLGRRSEPVDHGGGEERRETAPRRLGRPEAGRPERAPWPPGVWAEGARAGLSAPLEAGDRGRLTVAVADDDQVTVAAGAPHRDAPEEEQPPLPADAAAGVDPHPLAGPQQVGPQVQRPAEPGMGDRPGADVDVGGADVAQLEVLAVEAGSGDADAADHDPVDLQRQAGAGALGRGRTR
jgi:long-chain acyl-CoA synthetase